MVEKGFIENQTRALIQIQFENSLYDEFMDWYSPIWVYIECIKHIDSWWIR